jgi:nucleotide-binding universal stress UspA family protein
MLKTILCATDGSDHADKAVDWASDLAAKYGAQLVLLYVLSHREASPELRRMAEVEHMVDEAARPPRDTQPAYPMGGIGQKLSQSEAINARIYRELGERTLDRCKRSVEGHGIIAVKTVIEDGDPADRILEVAERQKADLIVMGRRGLGDLKGLLLGSVTHKVSQLSQCPCLTVR